MEDKSGRTLVLISCILASFLTPFMGSSINVALPVIGKEFAMNTLMLNWVATSFLLSAAVFLVPLGRVADIYGRSRVFILGLIIYTLSSFLLGFSFNSFTLIFMRVIQGMGGSMIFSTSVALVSEAYPIEKRGKVLGFTVTSVYVGISVGPVFGGYITHFIGWRSLFYLNAILGVIATLFVFIKMDLVKNNSKKQKFDLIGSIIYGLSLTMLMYGFSKIPSTLGLLLSASGILGIIIFFVYEKNLESPVLNIKLLLENKVFAFSNLAAFINYASTFAVGFLLSLYLQYIRGLTPDKAGLILISQPIMMALLSPVSGILSDKIEPRYLASIGMALTGVSLFLFSTLSNGTDFVTVVLYSILIGIGFGLFSSPNMNSIMSSIEKKYFGVGSAMQSTMRLVGQMFSMGLAMVMFSIFTGKVQVRPEYHSNMMSSINTSFLVFGILCIIGVYMSFVRGNLRTGNGNGGN